MCTTLALVKHANDDDDDERGKKDTEFDMTFPYMTRHVTNML